VADSKNALNMGGSSTAAFVVDITGSIQDMRQSLNLAVQEVRSLNQALQTTKSLVSSIQLPSSGGGNSAGGWSSNQIAPNPKFSSPSQAPVALNAPNQNRGGGAYYSASGTSSGSYGPSNNVVATTGSNGSNNNDFTGNTNLSDFVKKYGGGALFASTLVSGALKSPADTVEAQLLMQRSSYFSGGASSYGDINKLQAQMSYKGMANNDFDSMRALAAAQSLGITGQGLTQGGQNGFGNVAMGVSAASNLLPGLGTEGTMRAFSSMQQGKNVNMLRGIGIQLRDDKGMMKGPDAIIEDLWAKICRDYGQAYGSGRKPSENEVLIGLQPGNSLDSMLDQYFGNDPLAKQLVANGLLFKAKGGGKIGKEEITRLGGTTEASNTFFATQAESARGLGGVAAAGAAGYSKEAGELLKMSKFINDKFMVVLQGLTNANAQVLTLLGAGGGALAKLAELLMIKNGINSVTNSPGAINGGGIPKLASGGGVGDSKPYIVGEVGPELFIPKTDGVIIPNHLLNTKNRHQGGGVHGSSHPAGKTYKGEELRNILRQAGFTGKGLEQAEQIVNAESGGRSSAEGDKGLVDGKWDYSIGLFQVRSLKDWKKYNDPKREPTHLYDPLENAKEAYKISNGGTNWNAWRNSSQKLGFSNGGSGLNQSMLSALLGADGVAQLNALSGVLNSFGSSNGTGASWGSGWGGSSLGITGGNGKTAVININGAKDTKSIVDDVMRELKKQGFLDKAGNK
jgi:hypothetical protein